MDRVRAGLARGVDDPADVQIGRADVHSLIARPRVRSVPVRI